MQESRFRPKREISASGSNLSRNIKWPPIVYLEVTINIIYADCEAVIPADVDRIKWIICIVSFIIEIGFAFIFWEHLTKNGKPGRSKKKKFTPGLTWLSILYAISAFVAVFEEITFNFLRSIFERKKKGKCAFLFVTFQTLMFRVQYHCKETILFLFSRFSVFFLTFSLFPSSAMNSRKRIR